MISSYSLSLAMNNEKNMERQRSLLALDFEDDGSASTSVQIDDGKKKSHSEIEKRRRDKLNLQITELARILPMLPSRSRRLDKLSVLKMTVQYMKEVRSVTSSYTASRHKNPLISDKELNNLIVQIADGFVFAVICHRGEIIYMSKSVTRILGYSPEDLVRTNLFDYVHPNDMPKLKEQLFCSDVLYKDSNMKEELNKMCIGARRSFFCRMKRKEYRGKNDADTTTDSKNGQPDSQYYMIHCTGYLKPWRHIHKYDNLFGKNIDLENESEYVGGTLPASAKNVSCLVAVGRVIDTSASTSNLLDMAKRFDFKFTIDGKFLIVDQDITFIVGFLPQELLGNSIFEYFHPDDIPRLNDVHKATLQGCNTKNTEPYRFRTKDNNYIYLRSEWKRFQNPWTKVIDFITAKNYVIRPTILTTIHEECTLQCQPSLSYISGKHQIFEDQYAQTNVMILENQIESHLDACKIGKYVANSYLDKKNEDFDIKSTPSLTHHDLTEEAFNEDDFQSTRSTMAVFNDPCTSSSSRGGDAYGSNCAVSTNSVVQDILNLPSMASQSVEDVLSDVMTSPSQQPSCSDTNDGVDMALLMNMLEADAGLDGAIDNAGFPWPPL